MCVFLAQLACGPVSGLLLGVVAALWLQTFGSDTNSCFQIISGRTIAAKSVRCVHASAEDPSESWVELHINLVSRMWDETFALRLKMWLLSY